MKNKNKEEFSFQKSKLWKLKTKLQFTGWLQYIMPIVFSVIIFLIAGIGSLFGEFIGEVIFFWVPFLFASYLLIRAIIDIFRIKLGMHAEEEIPAKPTEKDVFELMRLRRSCRSFQKRKLTSEDYHELMEVVQKNRESSNLIGNKEIRFEYVNAPLTVWPVIGAQEFLVAIAPKEYDRLSIIDVGRGLQRIVHHATTIGVSTCWIGGGADQKSVTKHLGSQFDAEKDHVVCVCAIGYKSKHMPFLLKFVMETLQHKRLPLSKLFLKSSMEETPLNINSKPFNEYGRCYEVCQWAPSSFNSQVTRCVGVEDENHKAVRFDFFSSNHSRYYSPVAVGIWCANWEIGAEALGKKGSFKILSEEERQEKNSTDLPQYELSWVVQD